MSVAVASGAVRAPARKFLIREFAWWNNKVPLSVMLVVLMLAHEPLAGRGVLSLVLVVLIVACVANYGYGLNELFDREEDERAGRANVATERGARVVWTATLGSAAVAVGMSVYGAGVLGGVIILAELSLPATYSIPPIRTKERDWIAAISDATAAHVFPAVLAVLVLDHQGQLELASAMLVAAAVWGAATGLRGILSHLVWSLESDRQAGLETIAEASDGRPLSLLILRVLLPIELVAFAWVVGLADPGLAYVLLLSLYLVNELRRCVSVTTRQAFSLGYEARVFRPVTSRYVPFVDERFYKRWGPLLGPVAAWVATGYVWFLGISALFVVLFKPRLRDLW